MVVGVQFEQRYGLWQIACRSSELIENLLGEAYDGWLMSDGYGVYRNYRNRLRCWAHLLRKAQGLKESLDREARQFGIQTLELMETLIAAIHQARSSPPRTPLTETFQTELAAYRDLCEHTKTVFHPQTRALATEMLNDWEAIFRVLDYPSLPLTNNVAERALRHWVILRRISYGTRTEQGSRVFAILISVIETCRKRQQSPWIYLTTVIHSTRAGLVVPKLPPPAKGSE
ncbi:MAG: IS66 family transposase [Gammaproteobacteria bacterium]